VSGKTAVLAAARRVTPLFLSGGGRPASTAGKQRRSHAPLAAGAAHPRRLERMAREDIMFAIILAVSVALGGFALGLIIGYALP
jgi:hypothetical protein